MKTIIVLVLLAWIGIGCASREKKYGMYLQSLVGSDADKLISEWGPPAQEYKLANGSRTLAYVKTEGRSGRAFFNSFSSEEKYCKTIFLIDGQNTVKTWKWEGSTCRIQKRDDDD